ncbi:hypothetical protein J437_LFUL015305 [Ladona fulva]|uniref:Uncharacterized protein n=1 Tax=Ladona fulva TaxID=123851 RepID=A0A8K0KMQ1_LADFU|nr:hypothetical protein J437_LFUL015305 [Ladona fulva]
MAKIKKKEICYELIRNEKGLKEASTKAKKVTTFFEDCKGRPTMPIDTLADLIHYPGIHFANQKSNSQGPKSNITHEDSKDTTNSCARKNWTASNKTLKYLSTPFIDAGGTQETFIVVLCSPPGVSNPGAQVLFNSEARHNGRIERVIRSKQRGVLSTLLWDEGHLKTFIIRLPPRGDLGNIKHKLDDRVKIRGLNCKISIREVPERRIEEKNIKNGCGAIRFRSQKKISVRLQQQREKGR